MGKYLENYQNGEQPYEDNRNWFQRAIGDWAAKRINVHGEYGDAFKSKPKNVDPVGTAAFDKYLGRDYDQSKILDNGDGTFRLPKENEMQILTDTTAVKKRMENNKKAHAGLSKLNPNSYKLDIFDTAIKGDSLYLNQLRHMYNTGEPIVVHEMDAWKDRKLIPDGDVTNEEYTPLNAMRNFTLTPNAETGKIYYSDRWDLDKLPLLDRTFFPFDIKGTVPGSKYKSKK